ncbi:OsmC family protein [Gillisia sp. M10.2A]|uniref:OsmC family protein n=1 Tax=Gillisia lutea TaxID=2909668 RepID=A0ABS9EFD9_9FLAO|nr:OsmC family protein [Gillisia lutea]MCF4101567.1 OsmC family protein [Gillisia lutea]
MNYNITSESHFTRDAQINIKGSKIQFGTTSKSEENLPNPAELFLGSFAACILKNVERFSEILKFTYTKTSLQVMAKRLENPPRMDQLEYILTIYSDDKNLNKDLLKKNIEKFGTIFNTVKLSCSITGRIIVNKTGF